MTHRYQITFNAEQAEALGKLMKWALSNNRSSYLGMLIGAELERKEAEKNKRKPGRPKQEEEEEYEPEPDYTNDLPKNIIEMGRKIGPREKADIDERERAFKEGR